MTMWQRAIIHFDLDAFYASVEQKRDPSLVGRPVIVGGGSDAEGRAVIGRGVVSAASYEARAFGVRSAMPLGTALRMCPQAVVVPVDFVAYRAASAEVFAIVRDYTPVIEPLSLDEAYLDVTGSQRRFGPPEAIAAAIRDRIDAEVGLNASFGIAATKVVAKVASDLEKPRGFVVVPPGMEAARLAPLPLRTLPGLGPATEAALNGLGITTLGGLAALAPDIVTRRIGQAQGRGVWERAQGRDDSEVVVPSQPKSVSREETFGSDVADAADLRRRIRELGADVAQRLRAQDLRGHTVALKLRYSDFTTLSRQHSLESATDVEFAIVSAAVSLFDQLWSGAPVRLLGVGMSGFDDSAQLDLFSDARAVTEPGRDARIDRTLDSLRERFGSNALKRGSAAGENLRDLDFRGEDLRRALTSEDDPA